MVSVIMMIKKYRLELNFLVKEKQGKKVICKKSSRPIRKRVN